MNMIIWIKMDSNNDSLILIEILKSNVELIKLIIQKEQPNYIFLFLEEKINENINQDGIEQLEKFIAELPKKIRPKIIYIELDLNSSNFFEYSAYISSLFKIIKTQRYRVIINLTNFNNFQSIAFYLNSLIYSDIVEKLFFIKDMNIYEIWLYQHLNNSQKNILEYLSEIYPNEITPTDLQEIYYNEFNQGELPFISKILKGLKQKRLIEIIKEGRSKKVKLSEFGFSIMGSDSIKNILIKKLSPFVESERNGKKSVIPDKVLYNEMISDGFNDYSQWLIFKDSPFLNKKDFDEALSLNFDVKEGIAYYLYKTLKYEHKDKINIKDLLKDLVKNIKNSDKSTTKSNLNNINQISHFLKTSEKNKEDLIKLLIKEQTQIKSLIKEKGILIEF
ncbi:MAG: hypothetical protein ACTSQP_07920 [Promethearchaeota archaeon]